MINPKTKWWLTAALICLSPFAMALKGPGKDRGGCDHNRGRDCQQAPEGGSAAIYILGAGVTCLGAMFIRSRYAKPTLS